MFEDIEDVDLAQLSAHDQFTQWQREKKKERGWSC